MGLITKQFTFSSGAVIVSSEHNTNFDTLYTLVNGNIDNANIKAAAGIAYSKLTLTNSVVLADLASAIKSGSDATVITGTKGTANYIAKWNADGDLIDGYEVKDEDAMTSDSATALATQQSIKAYVDNNASLYEEFTSSGTFTAPTGVSKVYVSIVGAGGGGGAHKVSTGESGGGGGSGAYAIRRRMNVTPSSNYTVTIATGGAGGVGNGGNGSNGSGTTSFVGDDYTLSCNAGSGGLHEGTIGAGGTSSGDFDGSGTSGGGNETIAGGSGGAGGGVSAGGGGGGSPLGAGGDGATSGNGEDGKNYGSGGGGGARTDDGNGGSGADGYVLVEW